MKQLRHLLGGRGEGDFLLAEKAVAVAVKVVKDFQNQFCPYAAVRLSVDGQMKAEDEGTNLGEVKEVLNVVRAAGVGVPGRPVSRRSCRDNCQQRENDECRSALAEPGAHASTS